MAELKVDKKEDVVSITLVLAGRPVGTVLLPRELYDANPLRTTELALSLISAELNVVTAMAQAQANVAKKKKA